MSLYSVSARLAQASPSVSVEKGAYRLHAPPTRSPSKLRRNLRVRDPSRSTYQRQMAILVVFLVSATICCFGAAYYLFTTRWETRALPSVLDDSSDTVSRSQVVQFDVYDDNLSHDRHAMEVGERFLAYLPHSGFHNQRIAFENALVLSRLLNRTLLVPPVRLGNKPLYYLPFDDLRAVINNSSRSTLDHCKLVSLEEVENMYPECVGYSEYTHVPWEWLVNLTQIKSEQRLLRCWNITDTWLEDRLQVHSNDIFALKDESRNQYRFQDFLPSPTPISLKYLESVQISSLVAREERLLFLGTLFGSSRLHLRDSDNYRLRKHIRQQMAFTNPVLVHMAESIRSALGGQYLGAHVRLGDGLFQENAGANIRLIWWKLVHSVLGFSIRDALALERSLFFADSDPDDTFLTPPRIPLDIPALRVPHSDLPPLRGHMAPELGCLGDLHASTELRMLNTPLFVSTDIANPRTDPLLLRFTQTFPCIFFLADFSVQTSVLDKLENGYDGVKLKPLLMPFLDGMITARAWQVVGTEQSTFSAFVQDVLWRTYHGWEIVQRG